MRFEKKKEKEKSEHIGYAKAQGLTKKWKQTGKGRVKGPGEESVHPLLQATQSLLADNIIC